MTPQAEGSLPLPSRWRGGGRLNVELLETARRKRGLQWVQIAEAVGCCARSLRWWRAGKFMPSAWFVLALAEVLEVEPSELVLPPEGTEAARVEAFRSWRARWLAVGRE